MAKYKKMLKLMFKRKEAGLTQAELAERIGVCPRTIHHYENGERRPNIDVLKKLAEVLDCSVNDIT